MKFEDWESCPTEPSSKWHWSHFFFPGQGYVLQLIGLSVRDIQPMRRDSWGDLLLCRKMAGMYLTVAHRMEGNLPTTTRCA